MPTFRTNDGVSLSYTDEGSGRPVVLIHGYTAPAAVWALTIDALLPAGYRVIAFDRRGHGESESPMFGQRMARHGQDLAQLLDHLGLDDVTLVGASMGGNVIWAYVDLHSTARVRGIVIIDQTPKMLNTPDWPYGFYGFDASNAGTMFADGVPHSDWGRDPAKSGPELMRLVQRLGGPPAFRDDAAPEIIQLLADHSRQDWRDVVARTDRPVLMIAARESQIWSYEHAEAAVAGNPHGRVAIVEDSGHAVPFDQPDRLNELLLEFLESSST